MGYAMSTSIITPRFTLRELTQDDVTEHYLSWLHDEAAERYITEAGRTKTLDDVRRYIAERMGRDDVLFLGIFDTTTRAHIGNIKYEPIDTLRGFAVMGILIGDRQFRGMGVAGEVLRASAAWLKQHRGIRQILLGVHRDNATAIKAYERVGACLIDSPFLPQSSPEQIILGWNLSCDGT